MAQTNFKAIEKKWQDKWEKKKAFEVSERNKKSKFYVLEQFAYPSGSGLHIGHAFIYTIGDIFARFKRMNGFNVLYPVGYDSLGLPAENAAIKAKINPKTYTDNAIKYFSKQQKAIGLSYDWSRMFATHNPDYYKWDQWIFLKMFEKGLVYQKQSPVNYCRECNTVLANEQVHNGKCWRHENTPVEIKHLKQWYFKITDYAEELNDFSRLSQWPDLIKKLQKNWIGKSFGTEIEFEISRFGDISKKEFVFLHAFGDSSRNAFWNWLKKEIEVRGGKVVFMPDLPNTNSPKLKEQLDFVQKNYTFNENTIVVGHSLGNILMMKILEKIKVKIAGFVMVGAPLPRLIEEYKNGRAFKDLKPRPVLADYFDWGLDFKAIKEKVDKIIVLEDEKDHIVPKDDPRKLAELLDAEYILSIGNKTHYNGEKEENVLDCIFEKWPIFTTRPDTIYGVTFMVVSAQHPKLTELVTKEQEKEVEKFVKKLSSVSEEEIDQLEKEGVFTGSYAINPINNEKVPVYAGNFVLADYGCGMVMAVPAHDKRDFEFAKKYNIPIKEVIKGGHINEQAHTEKGVLINSDKFNDLENEKAKEEITKFLENKKLGRKTINFRLKDWLISRQRYWGTPIPMIYCEKCGVVPVPEKDLPVKLPEKVKFGKGNPLGAAKDWIKVRCPKCKGNGRREIDTMDTFVNSSWYHLRFCDPKNKTKIFSPEKANYWNPIDIYIGGKEHACMHDIYIRFYHKFLRDLGLLKSDEPAKKLFVQGIVHGEDGNKMSKSLGNTVDPMEVINKYSADSLRLFLISNASPESDFNWSEKGIQGSFKFLNKVSENLNRLKIGKSSKRIESKINKTIKGITEDIENLRYNLGVIKLRKFFDDLEEEISKKDAESFLKMLSVFCPHISEELWEKIGNKGFLSLANWPVADEKKIDEKLEKAEQTVNNTISDIMNILRIIEDKGDKGEKIYVYVMPFEKDFFDEKKISERVQKQVKIFVVNDKDKYDPKGIAKKSKPGRPGIFIE